ncbi:MAG: VTT domain-containing protein [Candidatus Bathyarchaeia archaeon]
MNSTNQKLSMWKISWIKSSVIVGLAFLVTGLILIFVFKFFEVGKMPLFLDAKGFVREYGFVGIFFATILAGTVVPLGSPALVVAAASFGLNPILLALTATVGFTIGMMINYFLACRFGRPYLVKKMGAEELEAVAAIWNRWGWILYVLFGAVPILPVEFLALVCGLLKTRIQTFLVLSFTPRLAVFILLAYFGEALGGWIGFI